MASLAFAPDPGLPIYRGQRDFARARLNLPARIVSFNGTSACTLIDMSRTGAKIAAADCPRVGAMVIIEGLPMELFGTVRWSRGGFFGFEFDAQMTHDNVIAMRHHADGEGERQKQAQLTYARNWVQGVF
ncbi:MAG TPA: PilZ domain-containing protein [Qipengyuania sp.]|nr:PilZ domain-containing protein [Qipengyuania sp.]